MRTQTLITTATLIAITLAASPAQAACTGDPPQDVLLIPGDWVSSCHVKEYTAPVTPAEPQLRRIEVSERAAIYPACNAGLKGSLGWQDQWSLEIEQEIKGGIVVAEGSLSVKVGFTSGFSTSCEQEVNEECKTLKLSFKFGVSARFSERKYERFERLVCYYKKLDRGFFFSEWREVAAHFHPAQSCGFERRQTKAEVTVETSCGDAALGPYPCPSETCPKCCGEEDKLNGSLCEPSATMLCDATKDQQHALDVLQDGDGNAFVVLGLPQGSPEICFMGFLQGAIPTKVSAYESSSPGTCGDELETFVSLSEQGAQISGCTLTDGKSGLMRIYLDNATVGAQVNLAIEPYCQRASTTKT
jgi:hypothetical protein